MSHEIVKRLKQLDRLLVTKRFPPLSPFWIDTFTKFYESGKRQLVVRAGRRAGKSSSTSRVAVVEALYGNHSIPNGDIGVVAFISISKEEASQRLRTIKSILDVLPGVKYKPIENGVEIVGRPVAFKVFAATIGGVSGFTTIFCCMDEVSKMSDKDSGTNPASEVLSSLRPTMATQKNSKLFMISSPFGMDDAHAAAFEAGDTELQMVSYAPTWVANPTLTQQECRKLAADEREFQREYLAIPTQAVSAAFEPELIESAFAKTTQPAQSAEKILLIDASGGKNDRFTAATAHWQIGKPSTMRIEDVTYFPNDRYTAAEIVDELCKIANKLGIKKVYGDSYNAFGLDSLFRSRNMPFQTVAWTNTRKKSAVDLIRHWLREGQLSLEWHEILRSELLAFSEKITVSGAVTYSGKGSSHDDFVALLLVAANVEAEQGGLPRSPNRKHGVYVIPGYIKSF